MMTEVTAEVGSLEIGITSDEFLARARSILSRELGAHADRVSLTADVMAYFHPRNNSSGHWFRLLIIPKNCTFSCPNIEGNWSDVSADDALAKFESSAVQQLRAALGVASSADTFDPVLLGC